MKSKFFSITAFAVFTLSIVLMIPQTASGQTCFDGPITMLPGTGDGTNSSSQKGIHIKGDDVPLDWTATDGAGFKWVINRNGQLRNVDNNAYNHGMQLQLNHNQFYVQDNKATISKDKTEIELGPWNYNNNQVAVYRRFYVDPQTGFVRFVDVFENESGGELTINVRYNSHLRHGIKKITTSSGKDKLTSSDWSFVTGFSNNAAPIAHIYSSRYSKAKPSINVSNGRNSMEYNFSIPIPAGEARAICLYEAQRKTPAAALKFAKEFDVDADFATLPPKLRKIIVNMGYSETKIGGITFPRSRKCDLVVLKNGAEITGTIENKDYTVHADWGSVKIVPQQIVGIAMPSLTGERVWVVLNDGQIICGELQNKTVNVKLANGKVVPIKLGDIATVSYRITDTRGEDIVSGRPMVVLMSGEQLKFDPASLSCEFLTEFCKIKLAPGDLDSIDLVAPQSSLHKAVLSNGSVITGLLLANPLELKLDLGAKFSVNRHAVKQLLFAPVKGKVEPTITLTLRNGNKLRGWLDEKQKFTILQTGGDKVVIAPADFKRLTRKRHYLDQAEIITRKGSVAEGKLENKTIGLKIAEGTTLWVPYGNVRAMAYAPPAPKPEPKPETPAVKPKPETGEASSTEAKTKREKLMEAKAKDVAKKKAAAEKAVAELEAKEDAARAAAEK